VFNVTGASEKWHQCVLCTLFASQAEANIVSEIL